ncbi:hypothetical protein DXG01_003304 [Tephrocybe rancida]|nr:hypothetical protein DXG01_003304 [Tephrocybe rancida]
MGYRHPRVQLILALVRCMAVRGPIVIAGVQCSKDAYSNCMERGFANICLAQPHSSDSLKEISPHSPDSLKEVSPYSINCIKYLTASVSSFLCASYAPLVYIYNHPKTVASSVLDCADDCKEDYDEWIAQVLETRVVDLDALLSNASSTTLTSSRDIELQTVTPGTVTPSNPLGRDRSTPEPIRLPPPNSTTRPSSPLARPPPPAKVVKLREAWYRYMDSRVVEWKIAATTACVFVAASPTIFQIPDASDDPITRSIAFFALCRALSGIVYGPIFPIYFRTTRARSVHFAMLWAQDSQSSRGRFFRGQWIMLSLPAVATSWATISFILAIFAYIWRTGSVADPSDWPSTVPERQPMSIDLALVLRIIITSITVVDIVCMGWIWRVLRGYSRMDVSVILPPDHLTSFDLRIALFSLLTPSYVMHDTPAFRTTSLLRKLCA